MVVEAGSEEDITPEDKWISKFSNWDLADDVPGSSSTSPQPSIEPVEESEDDDEDYE